MNTLYRYLYTSTMTDAEPACIPRILRTAKHNNRLHHVSGLLIFDGLHFCQYLEGDKVALDSLLQRIILDARHAEMKILGQGSLAERRFPEWPMGFALTDQPEALEVLHPRTERSPFLIFEALLPSLDFGDLLLPE
jgi:hypothetical protein